MTGPAPRATDTGVRLPDFFIVGQPKSGTTALHRMLSQHPKIFMSEPKEPTYLASDMRYRFQPQRLPKEFRELDEYLSLFADANPDQRVGEASTIYILSASAPREIYSLNPNARIIVFFREPAAFVRSLHLQHLKMHVETEQDLRQALDLESERRMGRHVPRRSHCPQLLRYSEFTRYTDQLRRYHDVFPRDHVYVRLYEDFRDDNIGVVRDIFRFLEIDDSVPVATVNANQAIGMRSQRLDDAVQELAKGTNRPMRLAKAAIKGLTPEPLRRRVLRTVQERLVYAPAPPADPELQAELRARFRPEVERFSEYLGRDLITFWGYENV